MPVNRVERDRNVSITGAKDSSVFQAAVRVFQACPNAMSRSRDSQMRLPDKCSKVVEKLWDSTCLVTSSTFFFTANYEPTIRKPRQMTS